MNPIAPSYAEQLADIARTLFRICIFKASPQDLPATYNCFLVTVIASVATNLAIDILMSEWKKTLIISILQVIVFTLTIRGILQFKNVAKRWVQTVSALLGTSSIIRLAGTPALYMFAPQSHPTDGATLTFEGLLIGAVLGVWSLAVMTTILKEAMEVSTLTSFFIAIGSNVLVFIVVVQAYDFFAF